jgi:type III pantothenate kinase
MDTLPHILACDCGNSSISFACAQGETLTARQTFRLGALDGLGEALRRLWEPMDEPKQVVAASVSPAALRALEAAVLEATGQEVLVVGRDLPLPIETALPQPEAVGTDRLCAAVAAFDRLGAACVVADYGTAVTIDCVSAEGVFLGGAILPGLRTGAKALHQATAQLPEIDPADSGQPDWTFGTNTRDAIRGGLIYGARGALREFVEAYATQLGAWPTVLLTGGDATLICPHAGENELVQAVVPDLTLRGVAIAYYKTLLRSE